MDKRKIFNMIVREQAYQAGGKYGETYIAVYNIITAILGIDIKEESKKENLKPIDYLENMNLMEDAINIAMDHFDIESISEIKERFNEEKQKTEEYIDFVYKN